MQRTFARYVPVELFDTIYKLAPEETVITVLRFKYLFVGITPIQKKFIDPLVVDIDIKSGVPLPHVKFPFTTNVPSDGSNTVEVFAKPDGHVNVTLFINVVIYPSCVFAVGAAPNVRKNLLNITHHFIQ